LPRGHSAGEQASFGKREALEFFAAPRTEPAVLAGAFLNRWIAEAVPPHRLADGILGVNARFAGDVDLRQRLTRMDDLIGERFYLRSGPTASTGSGIRRKRADGYTGKRVFSAGRGMQKCAQSCPLRSL
jgi:hypothetical protein